MIDLLNDSFYEEYSIYIDSVIDYCILKSDDDLFLEEKMNGNIDVIIDCTKLSIEEIANNQRVIQAYLGSED